MEQRHPVLLVRQGEKFSNRYVEVLTSQIDAEVITLTDAGTIGKTRPLQTNYKGWTAKMELFAPWNRDLRPCVYFDLDTFVLGGIEDILTHEINELWLIRDFYNENRSNSGMMLIPKETDHIWDGFLKSTMHPFRDGDFLNTFPHKVIQDQFDGIVSYKADKCQEEPKGRVVCWHGKPKQEHCEGWVKEIWTNTKL